MSIAARLAAVRARVQAAVSRRGPGADVTLVGVSKFQPIEAVRAAYAAGLRDFGENYAQELRDKRRALGDLPIAWHFIGRLQTNKVKYVLGATLIHTVDRAELLEALDERAARLGLVQDTLVQVNLAREPQKSGALPEDVPDLLDRFAGLEHVRCRGLMLIPPALAPEATGPHFAALRRLRDELAARERENVELRELSMGMSEDFEVAIEEGATIVRVGSAIFGPRPSVPAREQP